MIQLNPTVFDLYYTFVLILFNVMILLSSFVIAHALTNTEKILHNSKERIIYIGIITTTFILGYSFLSQSVKKYPKETYTIESIKKVIIHNDTDFEITLKENHQKLYANQFFQLSDKTQNQLKNPNTKIAIQKIKKNHFIFTVTKTAYTLVQPYE